MVEREPSAPAPAPEVPDPLLGKVLHDRFRIVERLGAGGMGTVYKAIQAPLERVVALKILNPSYGGGRDPGFQKRFFLEASVTSKLKHPNTITVIDYGKTDDNILYIAMEFLEGVTLSEVLKKHGPMPWQRALHIAQQIARSVREAHRAGIIHRDLKPANVMLLNEDTDHDLVKVLDFGLVKSVTHEKPIEESDLTQAGVFLGSPQYVSPEQARNKAEPRSDMYSLGVMIYQMIMGRLPFVGSQTVDLLMQHLREPPPPFASLRPEIQVPSEVEALVMRCLAKNPDDRFANMDGLLEEIRRIATGQSGIFSGLYSPPTPGPITSTSNVVIKPAPEPSSDTMALGLEQLPDGGRSFRTRKRWMVLAASLGVLAGAGVVFGISHRAAPVAQPVSSTTRIGAPQQPAIAHAVQPGPVVPAVKPAPVANPTPIQTPISGTSAAPVEKPRPPAPPVVFRIDSNPSGAKLIVDGARMGRTPVVFTRTPDAQGEAKARLRFELDGYKPATAVASGVGPEIQLIQRLHKKTSRHHRDGYKEDPYQ